MNKGKIAFFAFLSGFIVGAAIALLTTPYTGEEVRDRLRRKGKKLAERLREEIKDVINRVEEDIVSIEEEE